jgi:hypothetical protein
MMFGQRVHDTAAKFAVVSFWRRSVGMIFEHAFC